MIKKGILALSACALLGSGCAHIENQHGPHKAKPASIPDGKGLVVFSTGAAEKCVSFASFLKVLPINENPGGSELALLPVDSKQSVPDFKNRFGFLNVLTLPAGEYYLTRWLANPYFRQEYAERVEFKVEAGERKYLGEFFMTRNCDSDQEDVASEIRDQYERDSQALTEANAEFAEVELNKSIITLEIKNTD